MFEGEDEKTALFSLRLSLRIIAAFAHCWNKKCENLLLIGIQEEEGNLFAFEV